jgi:hypothetical protein
VETLIEAGCFGGHHEDTTEEIGDRSHPSQHASSRVLKEVLEQRESDSSQNDGCDDEASFPYEVDVGRWCTTPDSAASPVHECADEEGGETQDQYSPC